MANLCDCCGEYESDCSCGSGETSGKCLTLRDAFAAGAVSGYVISYADPNHSNLPPQEAAKLAYRIADAMLEARKAVRS